MTLRETPAGKANCAIAVMAKAPRPGYSKTRLCPPLDYHQAARMSAAFLRDTTENIALASASAAISAYAAYAPFGTEEALRPHIAPNTQPILADGSLDAVAGVEGFGRCLFQAIAGQFALGHAAACVLSSDTPNLPTDYLIQTANILLTGHDRRIVLGACDDGGYYLLGMRAPYARLFADIAWSTETVAAGTRLRAQELGLEVVELPPWYDIDDAMSLRQLLADDGGYAAPFTRKTIDTLEIGSVLQGVRAA